MAYIGTRLATALQNNSEITARMLGLTMDDMTMDTAMAPTGGETAKDALTMAAFFHKEAKDSKDDDKRQKWYKEFAEKFIVPPASACDLAIEKFSDLTKSAGKYKTEVEKLKKSWTEFSKVSVAKSNKDTNIGNLGGAAQKIIQQIDSLNTNVEDLHAKYNELYDHTQHLMEISRKMTASEATSVDEITQYAGEHPLHRFEKMVLVILDGKVGNKTPENNWDPLESIQHTKTANISAAERWGIFANLLKSGSPASPPTNDSAASSDAESLSESD